MAKASAASESLAATLAHGRETADKGYTISLQDAIEKQFGLGLEPRKNPVMVPVVDHVD